MAISLKKVEKWAQKKKVNKLLKALTSEDMEIRLAAIKALGTTTDETAMNMLITTLKDVDASIRGAAIEALGVMGNLRTLEFVRQLWNNETDENVREKARLAIIAIKENAAKVPEKV